MFLNKKIYNEFFSPILHTTGRLQVLHGSTKGIPLKLLKVKLDHLSKKKLFSLNFK